MVQAALPHAGFSHARYGSDGFERALLKGASFVAAVLLVLEVAIFLIGVTARYAFNAPLSWSDELASILFLWLAMAGVVIAFVCDQHMCIRIFFDRASERRKLWFERYAAALCTLIFLFAVYSSFEHAISDATVQTSAMEVSGLWRSAALPVGFSLLLLLSLARGVRQDGIRMLLILFSVAAAVGVLWYLSSYFSEYRGPTLVLFFGVLVAVALGIGVPIGIAFLLATTLYLACCTTVPLPVVIGRVDEGMSHFILLSVPLFVFLGKLMEETGMAKAIMAFLCALIGHIRGGLSYVLLVAMFIVSGISGSKIADMAAVAPVLFPEMKRRGGKPGEMIALLSSSGAMAETIPPSLILITTGVTVSVSIAALFTAGLLPAVLLGTLLCIVAWWRSRDELPINDIRPSWKVVGALALVSMPGLLLPFVIRSAVVEGVATPTEVSTIGIAYTVIVGMTLYRPFPWRRLPVMLVETASLSGAILFIVGAATAMAWALTQSGFSADLSEMIVGMPGGRAGFLVVSIIFFICLGSLLEGLPAIVLFAPLLFPTAVLMGVNEVQYTIVVVIAMGIGLFVPPFGVGYWAACAIGQVNPDEGMRPLVPYLAALLVGLALVAAVPWISIGFL
jgi:tripartite ATP-independent transporter DctM subunit